MRMTPVMIHLLRYCLVGGTTAVVHIVVLLLGQWMSLSLANPIDFLAASVAGYLGHSLLIFREETGGRQFARRWLQLQYVVNLSVCALLPLLQATTRSMNELITLASLKQATTTHACLLAINARSALFETVGLPAQS